MTFRTSVPNQSRLLSNYEILFESGGPGENQRAIPFHSQISNLNSGKHCAILLEVVRFLRCSQRQIKTISDKYRQTSVPNWSRLFMRFHSQKSAFDFVSLPSVSSYTNLNPSIKTTSRLGFGGGLYYGANQY